MNRKWYQGLNLLQRKMGKTPALLGVGFQVADDCNLDCPYCLRDRTSHNYMRASFFKEKVDELAELPYKLRLGLSYDGESLLHPRFPEMLQYAIDKDKFIIRFHTNGTWLHRLKGMNLTDVSIILSDHGLPVPQRSILNMVDKVGLVNYDGYDVEGRIAMWNSLGLTVKLNPNIKSLGGNLGDWGSHKQDYCFYPFTTLYVMFDGTVKLCCRYRARTEYGSVRNRNILEFWKSEQMNELRAWIKKHHVPNLVDCRKCCLWRYASYSKVFKL